MTTIDINYYRKRLQEMRDEVEHLSETTEDARRPVDLDQSMVGRLTRMDALQEQTMQLETERRRELERQRIDSALARIDEDEFGYCVSCGVEIEEPRLENDPTVPTCINCARKPTK